MSSSTGRRRAGLLIPLFSCPSTASWGIGDIGDVEPLTAWLAGAGQRILQLLPLNEMAPGQQSPYSAISAMAIDPIFISVPRVPEFAALGGEAGARRPRIARRSMRSAARRASNITRSARSSSARCAPRSSAFSSASGAAAASAAAHFQSYVSEQAWWLEDYSLFRALHARERERPWMEWPEALQRRDPPAIDRARRELADEVLFEQYLQWLAGSQWQRARRHAAWRRAVRRSAVHGRQRQRRRLGRASTSSASTCRSARRPMPSARPDRTGGCRSTNGTRWRPRTTAGCASAPGAAPICSTATASITWSASTAPTAAPKDGGARLLHAGRRAGAARARRNGARSVSRRRRGDHRGGSRHRPRLRARVARASRRAGLPRLSLGAALARGRAAVPRSRRTIRRSRLRPRARTTPSRWRCGGMRPPEIGAAAGRASSPSSGGSPAAPISRTGRSTPPSATCCSRSCSRRRPICCCCRCRTPSAGAIASTSRPPSPTLNWTYRLPWPVDTLDDIPEARERKEQLRAWSERYGRI